MSSFELPLGTLDPNTTALARHVRLATDLPEATTEGFILVSQGPDLPAKFLPNGTSPPVAHVLATTTGLGPQHTTTGLTAGQVLRASGATTAQFQRLTAADVDPGTFPTGNYTFGGTTTFQGQIASTVATGTAPLTIASTTLVANLNADLLDGLHASAFALASHSHGKADLPAAIAYEDEANTFSLAQAFTLAAAFNAAGAPFTVVGTTVVTNLNADLLDGRHETAFAGIGDAETVTGNWDWTSPSYIRFGHPAQTDGNDGKIGAALFGSGLNIVGTQTVALEGRLIRFFGSLLGITNITYGGQLTSTVVTGTAPFVVASTTKVANLNADLLDGRDETAFAGLSDVETVTGLWTFNRGAAVPFAVAAGSLKVTNLDSDFLDGFDETAFGRLAAARTWTAVQTFTPGIILGADPTGSGILRAGGAGRFVSGDGVSRTTQLGLGRFSDNLAVSLWELQTGDADAAFGEDSLISYGLRWGQQVWFVRGSPLGDRAFARFLSTGTGASTEFRLFDATALTGGVTGVLLRGDGVGVFGTDPGGTELLRVGGTARWKVGGIGPGALVQFGVSVVNADNPALFFRRWTGGASDYYHSEISNDSGEGLMFRTAPPAALGAEAWVSWMRLAPAKLEPVTAGGLTLGTAALPWGASFFNALMTIQSGGLQVTAGNLALGGAPIASQGVRVFGAVLSSSTDQRGASIEPTISSAATGIAIGVLARITTPAVVFTVTDVIGFYAQSHVKGAGSTITNAYGLYVEPITVGGTNYAIFTNAGLVSLGDVVEVRGAAARPSTAGGSTLGTAALPWGQTHVGKGGTLVVEAQGGGEGGEISLLPGSGGGNTWQFDSINNPTVLRWHSAGTVYLQLGTTLFETVGPGGTGVDFKIGSLGRFDSTDVPFESNVLLYHAGATNKWQAESLQLIYNAGDAAVALLVDNTSTQFLYFDPGAGADSPVGAPPTPVLKLFATHKGVTVAAYASTAPDVFYHDGPSYPADFRHFLYEYSIDNFVADTKSLATASSDKVNHGRLTVGTTYYYRARAVDRAANASANSATVSFVAVASSDTSNFGVVLATEIAVDRLAALSANIGIITAGQLRNIGNTAGLNLGGAGGIPGTWTHGINVEDGAGSGSMTRYLNFTATGSASFLKHERLEMNVDGVVKMYGSSGRTLFNLSASDYYLQHDAVTPLQGVLVAGTLPGTWTRYLSLIGSGTMLKHERLQVDFDGTVLMYQTSAQPLFKLTSADFLLQEDAVTPARGILIDGTLPGAWTRYLNLNGTGAFLKHERLEINFDGTVLMYQSGTQPLFKLTATDFLLQEDAVTPARGILIDGTLPGAWTRYVNLNGTGAFLKHERAEINYDGSVRFYSTLSQPLFLLTATDFQLQENTVSPTRGVNIMGTLPAGWTRYMNLNGTGAFLKHERLQVDFDGTVLMYQTSAQPLFKLNATDFLLQNDAVTPVHGILLDGTRPAGWLRYLDLVEGVFAASDAQGAPVLRVRTGKVGAGATDYGLQVFDAAAATIMDFTGAKRILAIPVQPSADSGTVITLDLSTGLTQQVRLTGTATVTLNNPMDGARYRIWFQQDATGSRPFPTINGPSAAEIVMYTNDVPPVLTTTPGALDLFEFEYRVSPSKRFTCMTLQLNVLLPTPQIQEIKGSVFNTAATAHLVLMPVGAVNAGDLLVCFLDVSAGIVTTPANWTLITSGGHGGGAGGFLVYAKAAAGTESGGSVNFVTSINATAAAQVYRITRWYGTVSGGVEAGFATGGGASVNPDPPSHSPSWTDRTMWLAACGTLGGPTITTYPTSYTNGTQSLGTGDQVASARRALYATVQDPGAYTISTAQVWGGITLSIRPPT